jgi:hypothetical protein
MAAVESALEEQMRTVTRRFARVEEEQEHHSSEREAARVAAKVGRCTMTPPDP